MSKLALSPVALLVLSISLASSPSALAQVCVPAPSGIVAWYTLDETSGTIAQDVTGDHPGAYFGHPSPAPGEVDGSLHLNGSADFVAAPDSDDFALGHNGDFSVELFANFDWQGGGSIVHPGDIFVGSSEGPEQRAKWLFSLGGGFLSFHLNGPSLGPQFFPLAQFSPTPGRWYHLAVTRAADLYTIWIDGHSVASAVNHSVIPNPGAPLTIGQAEGIGFMHGRLDEVTLYNRALTAGEIEAIAAAGHAGKCKGRSVSSVTMFPNAGGNIGTVTARIAGNAFSVGTRVSLLGTASAGTLSSIPGQVLGVAPDGREITVVFDLTGQPLGPRDLSLTLGDGEVKTVAQAFTVEPGRPAEPWVVIVGPGATRVNQPSTFQIMYGNRGNVDARFAPLWVQAPLDSNLMPGFKIAPPSIPGSEGIDWNGVPVVATSSQTTKMPLLITNIPPGTVATLPLSVTFSTQGRRTLSAWIGGTLSPSAPPTRYLLPPPPTGSELHCEIEDQGKCWLTVLSTFLHLIPGESCAGELLAFNTSAVADFGEVANEPSTLSGIHFGLADGFGMTKLVANCVEATTLEALLPEAQLLVDSFFVVQACKCVAQKDEEVDLDFDVFGSLDPNELTGVVGYGPLHYLSATVPLPYTAIFGNQATATAPAQQVVVNDPLDPTIMDLGTLRLGPISIGSRMVTPPFGARSFATTLDLRPERNLLVRIDAGLDSVTAVLSWRFTSIDPVTGQPPLDPLAGFLPPDVHPPDGEGSVSFTVMPKSGIATGTQVHNQATIVFDANPPLVTSLWLNTLDNSAPVSLISPASGPLKPITRPMPLLLRWSATDSGSGLRDYNVYVSEGGGPLQLLFFHTAATSGVFNLVPGKTYSFYSAARDQTGNVEAVPASQH